MKKEIAGGRTSITVFLLIIVAAISFGSGIGCDGVEILAPNEIREYEGVDLSSINAFRENSIKGPQEVDVESYTVGVTGLVANPASYSYDEVLNVCRSLKGDFVYSLFEELPEVMEEDFQEFFEVLGAWTTETGNPWPEEYPGGFSHIKNLLHDEFLEQSYNAGRA